MDARDFDRFISQLGHLTKRQREHVLAALTQASQHERVVEVWKAPPASTWRAPVAGPSTTICTDARMGFSAIAASAVERHSMA